MTGNLKCNSTKIAVRLVSTVDFLSNKNNGIIGDQEDGNVNRKPSVGRAGENKDQWYTATTADGHPKTKRYLGPNAYHFTFRSMESTGYDMDT